MIIAFIIWSIVATIFLGIGIRCRKSSEAVGFFTFVKTPVVDDTWANDEEGFYKWSAGILGSFPISEERMIEAASARDNSDTYFPFTAFDESGPVGFFTMRIPGESNEEVRFGFVIIDPEIRGKGYGKQMMKLGLTFAFELYGAKKVRLGVFENNEAAYYCYKSAGFKETGEEEMYAIMDTEWKCMEMEIRR